MCLSSTMMCAGCGCTNDRACHGFKGNCWWVWFDRAARVGLCSSCLSWPPSAAHPSQLVRRLARQWRRLVREAHRLDCKAWACHFPRVIEIETLSAKIAQVENGWKRPTWTKPVRTTRVTIIAEGGGGRGGVCGGGSGGRKKR